jgi:hypothetical protein
VGRWRNPDPGWTKYHQTRKKLTRLFYVFKSSLKSWSLDVLFTVEVFLKLVSYFFFSAEFSPFLSKYLGLSPTGTTCLNPEVDSLNLKLKHSLLAI